MVKCFKSGHGTLTSFGFALTLPTDVGCFKFSARPFVRAHPHFVQVRAQHSGCRFMLPVRARFFCECPVQRPEPSQRFGFALDTVEGRLTLRVRARSFVRAPCEGAPSLRSDSLRTPWEIVECWTLTSLRSG